MAKDAAGNVAAGDVALAGARDNLVKADHRLVALAGVAGLAVIETADAVLVADRADGEAVKQLVAGLARSGRRETVCHAREVRPWGGFTTLAERPGLKIREVELDPHARLTLQRHAGRDEHWLVVSGRASVRLGEAELALGPGESLTVPCGTLHRLANAGGEPLRLVEIQLGRILDESATERLDAG
jgi:mannose-6-phosphate isomerase-like protein (cupin superfamily)